MPQDRGRSPDQATAPRTRPRAGSPNTAKEVTDNASASATTSPTQTSSVRPGCSVEPPNPGRSTAITRVPCEVTMSLWTENVEATGRSAVKVHHDRSGLPRPTPRPRRSSLANMDRITIDPSVMGGVPCLRGLRIPVATVVNMVAGGMTAQQIVDELPPLEIEDVAAALRFAADAVADREIPLQPTA